MLSVPTAVWVRFLWLQLYKERLFICLKDFFLGDPVSQSSDHKGEHWQREGPPEIQGHGLPFHHNVFLWELSLNE